MGNILLKTFAFGGSLATSLAFWGEINNMIRQEYDILRPAERQRQSERFAAAMAQQKERAQKIIKAQLEVDNFIETYLLQFDRAETEKQKEQLYLQAEKESAELFKGMGF